MVAPAGSRVEVEPPVGAAPGGLWFAKVVEESGEAHAQSVACVGRRLDDGEDVLVDREGVVRRLLIEADRRLELRQKLHEDAGVARELERAARLPAEEETRELSHAVRREATAGLIKRGIQALRRELHSEG